MHTVKEHKDHHATYVLKKEPWQKDDKLQEKLNHGILNEVKLRRNRYV